MEASQAPFPRSDSVTSVWEEKLDGDLVGFGFDGGGLFIQSRGHAVDVGAEPRFALLKDWCDFFGAEFREIIGERHVVFGEWCLAKHTVSYDLLPHYFVEYDVYDRERKAFLSTDARRELLSPLPIVPVSVLHVGPLDSAEEAIGLILGSDGKRRSAYKGPDWRDSLAAEAAAVGLDPAEVAEQTDTSDAGEGAYLKVERDGIVVARHKFIRPGFLDALRASGSHWASRRTVRNGLRPGVDLFDYPRPCGATS